MNKIAALFYLLCAFAILGSIDIAYFHIFRFKLYKAPSSRGEQITHLLRTILFLTAMLLVMFVDAHGVFSLLLPVILLIDFLNSMIDVLLEPNSRQSLGGLPPMEYAVHMVTMFLSGAIMAIAVIECGSSWNVESRVGYRLLNVPPLALALGWQIIVIATGFCLFEGANFTRSLITAKTGNS